MANRRVACKRLHVVNRPFVRSTAHRPFDAAVLIAQGNFQVKHMFAVALKAKMAWLNHPRMHGANGDFMDFFAIDTIKIHDARHGLTLLFFERDAKHHVPARYEALEPHRLEPRVAFRSNAELLRHLPFK